MVPCPVEAVAGLASWSAKMACSRSSWLGVSEFTYKYFCRGLSAAVAVCLVSTTLMSPPAQAAVRTSDVDDVKSLFQEGRAHFEISEYAEAVESFRQAYLKAEVIEDEKLRNEVMVALLYNLAQAHLYAYQVDRDPSHLRQGQLLIERYMVLEPSEKERKDGEELRGQIDEKLAEFESSPEPEPEPQPEPEPKPESDLEPDPVVDARAGRGLIIGGAVVSGLSAVGIGVMGFGLADGPRAQQAFKEAPDAAGRAEAVTRGNRANNLAIAGGVVAGALLTTGVALIVVGVRKRTQEARPQLGLSLHPQHAGITLGMRF